MQHFSKADLAYRNAIDAKFANIQPSCCWRWNTARSEAASWYSGDSTAHLRYIEIYVEVSDLGAFPMMSEQQLKKRKKPVEMAFTQHLTIGCYMSKKRFEKKRLRFTVNIVNIHTCGIHYVFALFPVRSPKSPIALCEIFARQLQV